MKLVTSMAPTFRLTLVLLVWVVFGEIASVWSQIACPSSDDAYYDYIVVGSGMCTIQKFATRQPNSQVLAADR